MLKPSPSTLNVIRNLFSQHINRALRQTRGQKGKSTRIHHPQPTNTKDPSPRIHHRVRVPCSTHGISRGRMVDLGAALPDEIEDVGIGLDGGAGQLLGPDGDVCHVCEDLPRAFEGRDGDLHVCGVGEPVGADNGQVGRVGGSDGDVAVGQRGEEDRGDGGVVEAVGERLAGWLRGIARVGVYWQVAGLGPVGGEEGERGVGGGGEAGSVGELFESFVPGWVGEGSALVFVVLRCYFGCVRKVLSNL